MEIRKIFRAKYTKYTIPMINQVSTYFVETTKVYLYTINVRNRMEFRKDCVYISDEYLMKEKGQIDGEFDLVNGNDYSFHLILGNNEYAFNSEFLNNYYSSNNMLLSYPEFVISRLVE